MGRIDGLSSGTKKVPMLLDSQAPSQDDRRLELPELRQGGGIHRNSFLLCLSFAGIKARRRPAKEGQESPRIPFPGIDGRPGREVGYPHCVVLKQVRNEGSRIVGNYC